MLAYFCKYVPEEIFQSMDTEIVCVEPHVTNFTQADALMHPNMCSFSKAVLEEFEKQDYEGMIFTSCCDSSRRLYDIFRQQFPDKFFFCLDLPRKINDFAVTLYERQLQKLIEAYTAFSGKTYSEEKLLQVCKMRRDREKEDVTEQKDSVADRTENQKERTNTNISDQWNYPDQLAIALVGARPGSGIRQLITDHQAEIALDLTCTGISRNYDLKNGEILHAYAHALLDQLPCMRMAAASNRQRILEAYEDRIDGIIYHTVKFCDIYAYEYTRLHEISKLPILKIETDATDQCAGQILTRLEAFLESLRAQKGEAMILQNKRQQLEKKPMDKKQPTGDIEQKKDRYVMGIDSGSTSTNAVILNSRKEIIASSVIRTGAKSGESAQRILDEILQKAQLQRSDLSKIVSTGYGRVSIPFADENVTEISCHGKGAHYLNPQIRTILDIGGQDSKAIHLNEKGDVTDFVMNDKCAAGTGRFLEMMARTLEVDIAELGSLSLKSTENIEISSMCSVFAESEVISLIAQNKETSDIAHGIHMAIAAKAISLMRRVGLEPGYMMTGGVAKNPGVVRVLEEQLKAPLFISDEPEIVGALGAALYGLENL